MTIKSIRILSSVTPITECSIVSKRTYEFLAKLLTDKEANFQLIEHRRSFRIPEEGIDITPYIGKNLK